MPRILFAFLVIFCSPNLAQDIVIYGGTPGGIAAAVSAARMGREVTLVEYNDHIGGMTTSGLGKSDIENRAMIGGIFKEFVAGVHEHYIAKYGPTMRTRNSARTATTRSRMWRSRSLRRCSPRSRTSPF
jgi:flavin-dependent dehydrogenase